jgi:O-antigen ligase
MVGIPLLLSLCVKEKWNKLAFCAFIGFIVLLIISGGRTIFAGSILAIFAYVFLFRRKNIVPLSLILVLFTFTYILVIPNISLPGQVQRLTEVEHAMEEQESHRFKAYKLYWQSFLANPLLGKGIGFEGESISFETVNLAGGGHGAYMSILAIFGTGGAIYFCIMLFGSMYQAYKISRDSTVEMDYMYLALFAFFSLIIIAVNAFAGGNGYTRPNLWFIAGIIAGIKALNREERINIHGREDSEDRISSDEFSKE